MGANNSGKRQIELYILSLFVCSVPRIIWPSPHVGGFLRSGMLTASGGPVNPDLHRSAAVDSGSTPIVA